MKVDSAPSWWARPKGCEYAVRFPSSIPKETIAFQPAFGEYIQTEAVVVGENGAYLRMECLPITTVQRTTMSNKQHMLNALVQYATKNGIEFADYTYEVTARGFKTVGNVAATFGVQTYLGQKSLLTLYGATISSGYPSGPIVSFFSSVTRVDLQKTQWHAF